MKNTALEGAGVWLRGPVSQTVADKDLPLEPDLSGSDLPKEYQEDVEEAFRFKWRREAEFNILFGEARFRFLDPPNRRPAGFFFDPQIDPQYGFGAGVALIEKTVTTDGETPETSHDRALFGTMSLGVNLLEFGYGPVEAVLEGKIRVFAGEIIGATGEGNLRLQYNF